ncbi:MAG: hypothetical protein AB7O31_12180 [Burkholderiales bacterium]
METLFTYADQLISETWVEWAEKYLSRKADRRFDTSRGFQEMHGAANANERTRALELWCVGLLKGPLVTPQSGDRTVAPLGWRLVIQGASPLTPLGYAAYGLGKALGDEHASVDIDPALSAICAVFALQMGIGHGSRSGLTSSLFLHLRAQWPRPAGVDGAKWNRYLAAVLFCSLSKSPDGVLADFAASPLKNDYVLVKDAGTIVVDLAKLKKLVESSYGLSDVRPAKSALYWIGDPASSEPRGIFTLAAKYTHYLLDAAYEIDRKAASSGLGSPFNRAWERNGDVETPEILGVLGQIFSANGFSAEWRRAMKSLRKGVLDSLRYIEEGEGDGTHRLHYAHGCELQGQAPDKLEIEVSTSNCTASPRVGDLVATPVASYVVKKAVKDGDKWKVFADKG